MFESILLQSAPTGDNLTYIFGLVVALVSAIAMIFREYNKARSAQQEVNEKEIELQDALASEQLQRKGLNRLACLQAQVILAFNDGKIDDGEMREIVNTARVGLIETARETGLDAEEIIVTAEKLMQKKA